MQHLKSILVGTDFLPCSATALLHADRLASRTNASLHVLHVVDTCFVTTLEPNVSPLQRSILDRLKEDAKEVWKTFCKSVPRVCNYDFQVRVNNRIAGLLDCADAVKADLIVLGAFGDRKPDLGIGTVASGCVRGATCDVLIVRDNQVESFRSILVAIDFSENSRRAMERAMEMASLNNAAVHVLHVYNAPTAVFPVLTSLIAEWVEAVADLESAARKDLEAFCAPYVEAKPILHVKESSRPGREIARFAASHGMDMVVVGRRGRSNIRDMLLGSTAERILRDAPSSVMVVAPQE